MRAIERQMGRDSWRFPAWKPTLLPFPTVHFQDTRTVSLTNEQSRLLRQRWYMVARCSMSVSPLFHVSTQKPPP